MATSASRPRRAAPLAPAGRGRAMYLGLAPPAADPLPPPPPRFEILASLLPIPARLTVRVRTPGAFRAWLASARPGDRAVYHEGDETLGAMRLYDLGLEPLADAALRQSTARDVPLRSACRHIRGRLNGQGRCTLHAEPLPWGQGVRCYAVRV